MLLSRSGLGPLFPAFAFASCWPPPRRLRPTSPSLSPVAFWVVIPVPALALLSDRCFSLSTSAAWLPPPFAGARGGLASVGRPLCPLSGARASSVCHRASVRASCLRGFLPPACFHSCWCTFRFPWAGRPWWVPRVLAPADLPRFPPFSCVRGSLLLPLLFFSLLHAPSSVAYWVFPLLYTSKLSLVLSWLRRAPHLGLHPLFGALEAGSSPRMSVLAALMADCWDCSMCRSSSERFWFSFGRSACWRSVRLVILSLLFRCLPSASFGLGSGTIITSLILPGSGCHTDLLTFALMLSALS